MVFLLSQLHLTTTHPDPSTHISGPDKHFNDRFGFILNIAYQSLELCLHHKKIIFGDYFLSLICLLSPFLSLSVLSISTPLHFLVYMTDTSFCPHSHVLASETLFSTFFLSECGNSKAFSVLSHCGLHCAGAPWPAAYSHSPANYDSIQTA